MPEITVYFWVIKALSTAMGEATSDYLVHRLNPELAVALGFIGLVVALLLQFSMRRYVAWTYWLGVVMVGVFGTMAADVLHVRFGVAYAVSSTLYGVVLLAVFVSWQMTEKTLSIHSVDTPRREAFYWASVVATFALGTAVGDLTAVTFHLGYLDSRPGLRRGDRGSRLRLQMVPLERRSSPSGSPTWSPDRSAPRSPTGWASPRASGARLGRRDRGRGPHDRHLLPGCFPWRHPRGRATCQTRADRADAHTGLPVVEPSQEGID